jgi:hypothetical protein
LLKPRKNNLGKIKIKKTLIASMCHIRQTYKHTHLNISTHAHRHSHSANHMQVTARQSLGPSSTSILTPSSDKHATLPKLALC